MKSPLLQLRSILTVRCPPNSQICRLSPTPFVTLRSFSSECPDGLLHDKRIRPLLARFRELVPWPLRIPVTILLVTIPVGFFGLGTWEMEKFYYKASLIDDANDKIRREPMDLPKNVNLFEVPNFEYRRVRVEGVWDHARSILLGPRTLGNVAGYHVITPLIRGEKASTILVDRGFVSKEFVNHDPTALQRLAAASQGVEVLGLLRQGQKKGVFTPDNHPEKGEWYWADVSALAASAGGAQAGVQPVLVEALFDGQSRKVTQLLSEGAPIAGSPRIELSNAHQSYAVIWYSLSAISTVMMWYLVRQLRCPKLTEVRAMFLHRDGHSHTAGSGHM
ncbi:uncharacterized protein EI90DRAFT_3155487 [Cantharellus anzutake]|uniref:uncharacterized protein n=1 Tax=Cantharellus anzutake TaxID=1750568 RepID=UPI001906D680|nr:uncharacterized protein EI90DRAFT_3155487 [Cantharellus anzutake]KAF8329120.1 hypothetical protein EI90DRAFT_3155487 [Cantharellus anzutake]